METRIEIDARTKAGTVRRVTVTDKDLAQAAPEELILLLATSNSSHEKWVQVALAYHRLKNYAAFVKVLSACIESRPKNVGEKIRGQDTLAYLHNVLAAHYLSGFLSERDLEKKEEFRIALFAQIDNANNQNRDYNMSFIKEGFATIAQGNLTTAKQHFDNAIEINSKDTLALFGRACLAYNQGQYAEALKEFQHIFALHPTTPLNVRMGIGICFFKLGDFRKARMAFERCLQINPSDDRCLVYLGIIAEREGMENIPRALELFQRAYKLNPNNPLCLLQLAQHYFYRGDLARAETLAKKGLVILDCYRMARSKQRPFQSDKKGETFAGDIHSLRADLHFVLGKIAHSKEQYTYAQKMYTSALEEDPQHHPAMYCLGQVLIQMKQFAEAETKFRTLQYYPQYKADDELTKLLAYCNVKLSKKREAIERYEQVVSAKKADVYTLVELAQLLELERPEKAVVHYKRALDLLKTGPTTGVSAFQIELLNNIAVEKTQTGKFEEAKEDFKQALRHLAEEQKKAATVRTWALKITLNFNLGYTYEMMGSFGEASDLYKRIIKTHPDHVDSYMRLSIMAMRRGNYQRAIAYAEDAIHNQPDKKSHVCDCFLANIFARLGETRKALELFNSVSAATAKHDAYALVGGAAMVLATAQKGTNLNETLVKSALQDFVLALEHEEKNVYAAVGVASSLALLGRTMEAIQIYKVVKESSPEFLSAITNLGRTYMAEGKRVDAIPIYRTYLEKHSRRDEAVELELACAYFQEQMYDTALVALKKLMLKSPGNPVYKYNAGVCLLYGVKQVFDKRMRKVSETAEVIRKLKLAMSLFEEAKHAEQNISGILTGNRFQAEARETQIRAVAEVSKKADEQIFFCEDKIKTARSYLEYDQKVEREQKQLKLEQERKEREKAQAEKNAAKKLTISEEEQKEIDRRIAELNAGMKEDPEEEKKKKKGKKGRAKKEEPELSEGDQEILKAIDEDEEPEFEEKYEPDAGGNNNPEAPAAAESKPGEAAAAAASVSEEEHVLLKKKRLHKQVDEAEGAKNDLPAPEPKKTKEEPQAPVTQAQTQPAVQAPQAPQPTEAKQQ